MAKHAKDATPTMAQLASLLVLTAPSRGDKRRSYLKDIRILIDRLNEQLGDF